MKRYGTAGKTDVELKRTTGSNGNATTPRKRRLPENDLASPQSFRRKNRVATFDPLSDDE